MLAWLSGTFVLRPSREVVQLSLFVAYIVAIAHMGTSYYRRGRVLFTPGLVLFGLVVLYSLPIAIYAALVDPVLFEMLGPALLMLAMGMLSIAIVLALTDRPEESPQLARGIADNQTLLCVVSYLLTALGVLWMFAVFRSLSGILNYAGQMTYYEKHVQFQGSAVLGMFTLCFELAGIVASILAAVPKAERRVPLLVTLVPIGIMVLVVTNRGYRAPLILALCSHVVASSAWRDGGVRLRTLLFGALVLTPTFLLWAHLRYHISSANVFDLDELSRVATASNWTDLTDSELSIMAINAERLLRLIDTGAWDFRWGETMFLEPINALVPRTFWQNRPDTIQILFTKTVAPDFAEGGTVSFSFILEGYLNFGTAGVLLWSGLLALAVVGVRKWMTDLMADGRFASGLFVFNMMTVLWFYIRDDFSDLLRRAIIVSVILAVPLALAKFGQELLGPARRARVRQRLRSFS
jgi:oligosaccharide repeat unit polymerase